MTARAALRTCVVLLAASLTNPAPARASPRPTTIARVPEVGGVVAAASLSYSGRSPVAGAPALVSSVGDTASDATLTTPRLPGAGGEVGPLDRCLRRRVGGGWGEALSFCAGDIEPPGTRRRRAPSPADVARALADRAAAAAPAPAIRVAPSDMGLAGLDTYVWVDEPAPITASAAVAGVAVVAEARPVSWKWRFGDGSEWSGFRPGTAWSGGRPGAITHVYETSGRYRLTVEQVWEARWRVDGGPWRPLGYFSNAGARLYGVRQLVALLVPTL